jgi:carboxylate-amine ligase
MNQPSRLHLFQAFGIELEYMIVDRESLAVRPIADEVFKHQLRRYESDFENGIVTWSNELVAHVIELKSTHPESNFSALEHGFADNVQKINRILDEWDAMLLPTAAHPLMNPLQETRLWPHDNNDVYQIYNAIFDCRGHGWSNLQSTHLNLPFYDDEEFAKLHAAVRIILPLLPALCASSPILEGRKTGSIDTRLSYYKTNQSKLPSITGKVIPEAIFSKRNYHNSIYEKIKSDIAPFDEQNILNPIWVNSRGAIPRFDRGSIEIRVMDIQECPAADMAIIDLVIDLLKALVSEKWISLEMQMKVRTDVLADALEDVAKNGGQAEISSQELIRTFDLAGTMNVRDIWKQLFDRLLKYNSTLEKWKPEISLILSEGTLAERILKSVGDYPTADDIQRVYRKLSQCLAQNKMFVP